MLSIRLKPIGKKKQISYRVVVMEKRSKLKGKFIEDLGFYNPHSKDLNFKSDRVNYWIGVGAQPSDTVHNLMIKFGIIKEDKRKKKIRPSKKKKEEKKEEKVEVKEEIKEGEEEKKEEVKEGEEEKQEPELKEEEKIKEEDKEKTEEKDISSEKEKE